MQVASSLKIFVIIAITSFFTVFSAEKAVAIQNNENVKGAVEILAFGDSLTAGYGLPAGDGFTDQLEVWLTEKLGKTVKVTNGGVSGDTSSGGRSRLDWSLAPFKNGRPDLVILELGANDALRGVQPEVTRENMDAMMKSLSDKGIKVLLAGMLATPSWGPEYGRAFDTIYPDMAKKYNADFYPFFLDGVAADQSLNQSDGLHPTKEGVAIIIEKIGPYVIEALSHD
ncbi:arylesterase [Kordiimonas laminariae]|uniref:arylesterase n=1 Tax=Kordiimonas laminariae TaxID=2917717 RepID=UPI001FF418A4|nr:arylesterase [Kordiimonas laminariae]MCK0069208.1 arylesterase [Kordiimonas laminariae]